ncbi:MAG: hypothetical protein ACN4GW_11645, partial [Desulforhopalus sp.]
MNKLNSVRKIIIFTLLILVYFPFLSYGFNDEFTHPGLSRIAFEKSNLSNILFDILNLSVESEKFAVEGKKYSALSMLRIGAEEEDEPACRAANHFHNPLSTSWEDAELTDNVSWIDLWCETRYPMYTEKYSTVIWATNIIDKNQNHHGNPLINYVYHPELD